MPPFTLPMKWTKDIVTVIKTIGIKNNHKLQKSLKTWEKVRFYNLKIIEYHLLTLVGICEMELAECRKSEKDD